MPRIWHFANIPDDVHKRRLCYAESKDGHEWTFSDLGLLDAPESTTDTGPYPGV